MRLRKELRGPSAPRSYWLNFWKETAAYSLESTQSTSLLYLALFISTLGKVAIFLSVIRFKWPSLGVLGARRNENDHNKLRNQSLEAKVREVRPEKGQRREGCSREPRVQSFQSCLSKHRILLNYGFMKTQNILTTPGDGLTRHANGFAEPKIAAERGIPKRARKKRCAELWLVWKRTEGWYRLHLPRTTGRDWSESFF